MLGLPSHKLFSYKNEMILSLRYSLRFSSLSDDRSVCPSVGFSIGRSLSHRLVSFYYPGQEPRQTTSNLGHLTKPSIQALIHGLNRHYYSISINYRKNELEQKMLLNLNKKSWVDGLTLQVRLCKCLTVAIKMYIMKVEVFSRRHATLQEALLVRHARVENTKNVHF